MIQEQRRPISTKLYLGLLLLLGLLLVAVSMGVPLRECPLRSDHVPFQKNVFWRNCPLCGDRDKITLYEEWTWKYRMSFPPRSSLSP